jgi:hypothetical protein
MADLLFTISGVASLSPFLSGDFGVSPAEESSTSGLGLRGVEKSALNDAGLGGSGLLDEAPIVRDFDGDELCVL